MLHQIEAFAFDKTLPDRGHQDRKRRGKGQRDLRRDDLPGQRHEQDDHRRMGQVEAEGQFPEKEQRSGLEKGGQARRFHAEQQEQDDAQSGQKQFIPHLEGEPHRSQEPLAGQQERDRQRGRHPEGPMSPGQMP